MFFRYALLGALGLLAHAAPAQHPQLRQQLASLTQDPAAGQVGIALRVLETNDTLSYHDHLPYPQLSVFKLAVAMAVLRQVDAGRLALAQPVPLTPADLWDATGPLRARHPAGCATVPLQELLTDMVTVSDNNACDVLLRLLGGPHRVAAYVRRLGIRPFVVQATEAQMNANWASQYRNWCHPSAQVALLASLYRRQALSEASTALLWQLLLATTVGPRRLRAGLPSGTALAHRTGTSGTSPQGLSPATNDVGVLLLPSGQHLALAVLVRDARLDLTAREALIAHIAEAVYQEFAGGH